jgi:hypothetical protein
VLAATSYAQQLSPRDSQFIVLRTDRVVVSTGESTHLNCSIVGLGDAAQMSCESHTSTSGLSLVYHLALVVGSNQIGYVVSCGGGLIRRIGCQPLATGQVLQGTVHGDKLALSVANKAKNYRIETSAYVGPLTSKATSTQVSVPPPSVPSDQATVKNAVEKEREPAPANSTPSEAQPIGDLATVNITSEPTGADILVDGNFMGSTPSSIHLPAGSHNFRIEAKGRTVWNRTVMLTSGGKISLHATLGTE